MMNETQIDKQAVEEMARNRLINLIRLGEDITPCVNNPEFDCKGKKCRDCEREGIAKYLLANGVIVPPVKIGQTIYYMHERGSRVYEGEVISFVYVSTNNSCGIHYDGGYGIFGRYVFLTKEEAEQALAKMKGGKG